MNGERLLVRPPHRLFVLIRGTVPDYDAWKQYFDSDPVGRKQVALGHRIMRSVENPNEVFIQIEFGSPEEAKAFRERLLTSVALESMTDVLTTPTVTEVDDETLY